MPGLGSFATENLLNVFSRSKYSLYFSKNNDFGWLLLLSWPWLMLLTGWNIEIIEIIFFVEKLNIQKMDMLWSCKNCKWKLLFFLYKTSYADKVSSSWMRPFNFFSQRHCLHVLQTVYLCTEFSSVVIKPLVDKAVSFTYSVMD